MIQDLPQSLIDSVTNVLEARRNPKMNPKQSAYELLKQYADRDDIYISFTEINKIGLNPKSGYNTPIGIYTYPLKITWEEYDIDWRADKVTSSRLKGLPGSTGSINKVIEKAYPFASENPYIQVLQRKPSRGFVDLAKYSQSDYSRDIEKLYEMINEETVYRGFPFEREVFENFVKRFEKESNFKSPGGLFWNVTRLFSKYFDDEPRIFKDPLPRKPLVAWNVLLQRFGYDAFLDSEGEGIIHKHEPWQAVFLTKRSFKHIDTILNDRSELVSNRTPKWLIEAETKDADFTVSGGVVFWHSGTWISGEWRDGIFEDGTFEMGVWKNGIFRGGTWENGMWEDGVWEDGTWIEGFIVSKRFTLITWEGEEEAAEIESLVSPKEFYEIEKRINTSSPEVATSELKQKVYYDLKPEEPEDDFEQI